MQSNNPASFKHFIVLLSPITYKDNDKDFGYSAHHNTRKEAPSNKCFLLNMHRVALLSACLSLSCWTLWGLKIAYLWLDHTLLAWKCFPTHSNLHNPNYLTTKGKKTGVQSASKKIKYTTAVRLHRITNSSSKNGRRNPQAPTTGRRAMKFN